MAAIQATEVRELVEAAITSISTLGGSMAYFSGFAAAQASKNRKQRPGHA